MRRLCPEISIVRVKLRWWDCKQCLLLLPVYHVLSGQDAKHLQNSRNNVFCKNLHIIKLLLNRSTSSCTSVTHRRICQMAASKQELIIVAFKSFDVLYVSPWAISRKCRNEFYLRYLRQSWCSAFLITTPGALPVETRTASTWPPWRKLPDSAINTSNAPS